jgi:hypothetical protein
MKTKGCQTKKKKAGARKQMPSLYIGIAINALSDVKMKKVSFMDLEQKTGGVVK